MDEFRQHLVAKFGDPFVFPDDDEVITRLGRVTKLTIGRGDGKPMSWREVWNAFSAHYPNYYAIEVFPPKATLVDKVNNYHLWLIHDPEVMREFDLKGGP